MPGGLETRTSILPTMQEEQGPGVLGPDYDFADNIKLPGQVGVRNGDDFASVYDSLKGVGYYVDMIGFGNETALSRGTGVRALGVNTFMKTGMKCPNGEDMWTYVEGIPKGDALGRRVAAAMQSVGYPALQGLAPGIVEDAKDALDPTPILNAAFGSGYPACELVERVVGDQNGQIINPGTGKSYIQDSQTAYKKGDGRFYQKRWVQMKNPRGDAVFLTKEQYDAQGGGKKTQGFRGGRGWSGRWGKGSSSGSDDSNLAMKQLRLATMILGGVVIVGLSFPLVKKLIRSTL